MFQNRGKKYNFILIRKRLLKPQGNQKTQTCRCTSKPIAPSPSLETHSLSISSNCPFKNLNLQPTKIILQFDNHLASQAQHTCEDIKFPFQNKILPDIYKGIWQTGHRFKLELARDDICQDYLNVSQHSSHISKKTN